MRLVLDGLQEVLPTHGKRAKTLLCILDTLGQEEAIVLPWSQRGQDSLVMEFPPLKDISLSQPFGGLDREDPIWRGVPYRRKPFHQSVRVGRVAPRTNQQQQSKKTHILVAVTLRTASD